MVVPHKGASGQPRAALPRAGCMVAYGISVKKLI